MQTRTLLTIQDSGPGFSEDAIKNLFDLFALGEDPVKLNLGLHLTMSKLIMEAHGGDIRIENHPSGGAIVALVFRTA